MRTFAPMKFRKSYFVLVLLLCLVGTAVGQWRPSSSNHRKAVYGTDYYVAPSDIDYSTTALNIVDTVSSRYGKAQRIFLWICDNITFDRSGSVRTADGAWRQRTAVCQGYCELFYRLGETVGLKTRLVYGKCRRPSPSGTCGSLENHVWLSVATERGSILIDPTWGAGYFRGGNFVRQEEPLRWFDVDPAWFVFTHLPNNHQRQYLSSPITDEQFARLPFVAPPAHPDVAEDAHHALEHALSIISAPVDTLAAAVENEDEVESDTIAR